MSEQKESSVLFSLKELMSLEEDRIKQEDDSRKRKEEEALRVKMEAERQAREAEESRIRTAEEQRRVQEARAREEATRLDAIRQGEVEKARLDAENAARMEALKHQQDHERQLVQMKESSGKKKLTFILAGLGVLLVGGTIAGAIAIKGSMEKAELAEREKAALEAKFSELETEKKRIQDEIEKASGAEKEALLAKLKAKEDEIQRQKQNAPSSAGAPVRRGPTPTKAPSDTAPKKKCAPGDPLCSEF